MFVPSGKPRTTDYLYVIMLPTLAMISTGVWQIKNKTKYHTESALPMEAFIAIIIAALA